MLKILSERALVTLGNAMPMSPDDDEAVRMRVLRSLRRVLVFEETCFSLSILSPFQAPR